MESEGELQLLTECRDTVAKCETIEEVVHYVLSLQKLTSSNKQRIADLQRDKQKSRMITVEQSKTIKRLEHENAEYAEEVRVNTSVIADLNRRNFTLVAEKQKVEEENARLKVQLDEEKAGNLYMQFEVSLEKMKREQEHGRIELRETLTTLSTFLPSIVAEKLGIQSLANQKFGFMISSCREVVRYIQNKGPNDTLELVQQYPPDEVTKRLRHLEFDRNIQGYRECRGLIFAVLNEEERDITFELLAGLQDYIRTGKEPANLMVHNLRPLPGTPFLEEWKASAPLATVLGTGWLHRMVMYHFEQYERSWPHAYDPVQSVRAANGQQTPVANTKAKTRPQTCPTVHVANERDEMDPTTLFTTSTNSQRPQNAATIVRDSRRPQSRGRRQERSVGPAERGRSRGHSKSTSGRKQSPHQGNCSTIRHQVQRSTGHDHHSSASPVRRHARTQRGRSLSRHHYSQPSVSPENRNPISSSRYSQSTQGRDIRVDRENGYYSPNGSARRSNRGDRDYGHYGPRT